MANRRSNYGGGGGGGGYGGGYNQSNRANFMGSGLSGVNPWQSGNSPGRSGTGGGNGLFATSQLLNHLTSSDSQLALATKLLSSILPVQQAVQQPPSLMSLNSQYGNPMRFGNYGGDRFRRDDRRNDNFRSRRQALDRNKDRKGADYKGRSDKSKTKPIKDEDKDTDKGNQDEDEAEASERKDEEMGEDKQGSEDKKDTREEGPLPEYEGIPTKMFNCHVCGKSMWNDVSFDTHVKGRNHRNKMRDLEESYQVQTDLMRQIAAVSLKLEELRRGGKRRPYPEQYCKMCDLHFNQMTMFAHRSTSEHQSLKRFIHPSCEMCKVDFQVRIEYDEHVLTPGHLQQEVKAALRKEKFDKDPKYIELRENEAKLTSLNTETAGVGAKGDSVLNDDDRALIATLMEEDAAVPEYDPDAEQLVAQHLVTPQFGYFCKVCKLFLLSEVVVDTHCRTVKHYNNYMNLLKSEATKKQKEADVAAGQKRKPDASQDSSGDSKRRNVESVKESLNGGEKYDPEETLEDDPAEESSPALKEEASEEGATMEVDQEEEEKAKPAATPRRGRPRGSRK